MFLAYQVTMLVNDGAIRQGEDGATTGACPCIILIFLDLLVLLEYMSALDEKDDEKRVDTCFRAPKPKQP